MEAIAPAVPTSRPTAKVNPNAVLGVVAVAQFMVILDATVVNVALPTIQRHLGFSEQSLSWILNAYTLTFGGFLLLGGRLADQLGRRRLFFAGITLFSAASLICGVSQSPGMLLAARGAQGLGGAMVSPAALSIVLTTFAEGPARNRALAVWGSIAGVGGAVGLLLGGVLVSALTWRWVFFINVPVGAAVLALTPRVVPESRAEVRSRGYDVEGAVTITLGLTALVFTLIKAQSWGWGSARNLVGFAVAAALIAAFIWIERRQDDPLVPLRIFKNRSLAAADVTFLLLAAALFGMFYFCTLYLQQVLGYSALKTGVAYMPFSVTLIGASAAASRLVDRFTPKPVVVTGVLLTGVGFLFLTGVSGHGDYASQVLPAIIIIGAGLGLAFVGITIAATTGVAAAESGLASGLLNTTLQVGGSLGLAILSSVSTSRITSALDSGLPLPAALTHGFKGAFAVAAVLCSISLVVALVFLPGRRRRAEDEQVETIALSSIRCPGAPHCGHLARLVAVGRRIRGRPAART